MDNIISEARSINQNTFLNHIFDTSEEAKAEILNVVQYAITGILPVVALNKTIQIFIQIVVMFVGVVIIHRLITYFPTYSGYKYEAFNLTTVILAFLVIVLSLQTKLGIKVNILVDRALELWNGPSKEAVKKDSKRPVNNHATSQADTLDNSGVQSGMFPPPPAITTTNRSSGQGHDYMLKASSPMSDFDTFSPAPANSALAGGSFW